MSSYPYLKAVLDNIPDEFSLHELNQRYVETVLRFATGGECPESASDEARQLWYEKQLVTCKAIEVLRSASLGTKRSRDEEILLTGTKRLKSNNQANGSDKDVEDEKLFTICAISVTSPVRKKVDITVGKNLVVLTHPTTQAVEASIQLSSLKRAFLLPTTGKQKAHWTIVLISSDSSPSATKGKGKEPDSNPQLIFGIDATLPAALNLTVHTPNGSNEQTVQKGEESLPILRQFLFALSTHVELLEPSTQIYKSACPPPNTQSSPGVTAYRGPKSGTLWFLAEGILYGESRPCEFWALEDLMGKEDGLRMISATGRSCSVILSRKHRGKGEDDDEYDENAMDEDGDQAVEEGEETEFAMIDGREMEPIRGWVRRFQHLFGKARPSDNSGSSGNGTRAATRQNDASARVLAEEDSDADDSDFTSGSEDLDGSDDDSDSEDSDESGGEGKTGESGESGAEEDKEGEVNGDGEGELDPRRHPLLRPGAMPKMSKASMVMAVGIVEQLDMGTPAEENEEDELED